MAFWLLSGNILNGTAFTKQQRRRKGSTYLKRVNDITSKRVPWAVPLQAWSGPEGSRKLRFPDFITTAQDGGKVVSFTHRPPLPPGNAPGNHFWNLNDTSWDRTSYLRFVAQHLNHCATAVSVYRETLWYSESNYFHCEVCVIKK